MKTKVLNDFTKVFTVIPDSQTKVKSSSYLESGKYAVVDQSKELVAGYTNTAPTVNESSLPVIVFGDHTRAVGELFAQAKEAVPHPGLHCPDGDMEDASGLRHAVAVVIAELDRLALEC